MKFAVPMGIFRGGAKLRYDKDAPLHRRLKLQRRVNWFTGNVERGYFLDAMKIGLDIAESGYTGFKKFKSQMSEMGIDVDALIDEECVGLITTGDIQKLKNEYRDLVK